MHVQGKEIYFSMNFVNDYQGMLYIIFLNVLYLLGRTITQECIPLSLLP